jgi:hypothetical protein
MEWFISTRGASPCKRQFLMLFAGDEHPETFRGVTFLENDCHFAMVQIDTPSNKVSGDIKLTRAGQFWGQ